MYSILVGDYREEFYWFEIYEIGRKFTFVCLLLLYARGTVSQIFAACCVSFCTFSVQMHVRPYKRASDNLLKACAEAQLFCTLLGTLVLRLGSAIDAPAAGYDAVLTGVTLVVFPLTAAIVVGRPGLRNMKHCLTRRGDSERSSTPVMKFRGFDGLDEQGSASGSAIGANESGLDDAEATSDVGHASPKRTRQADWRTVERGGQLKWSKTYRVPRSSNTNSQRSFGSGRSGSSHSGSGKGGANGLNGSTLPHGSKSTGSTKESTLRKPGKPRRT